MSERFTPYAPMSRLQRAGTALALGFAVCTSAYMGAEMNAPPAQSLEAPAPMPQLPDVQWTAPPVAPEECPPASARSRKIATFILDRPLDPELSKKYQAHRDRKAADAKQALDGAKAEALQVRELRNYEATKWSIVHDAAEAFGVTVHDPVSHLHAIDHDIARNYANPQLPFDVYYKAAKSYLEKFGIDLTTESTLKAHGANPTAEQLETPAAKQTLYELIDTFSTLPQEYIDLVGAKKIDLRYLAKNTNDEVGQGWADAKQGRIELNIATYLPAIVPLHELAHLGDPVFCNSIQATRQDSSFARLTVADYVTVPSQRTHRDYARDMGIKRTELNSALSAKDTTRACKAQKELRMVMQTAPKIGFLTPHAARSAAEDGDVIEQKAETLGHLTDIEDGSNILDPQLKLLRAQAVEVTARLHDRSPRLAGYFHAVHYYRAVQVRPSALSAFAC